ncbi:MAG: aminoacyl-tRNA deacylase [Candidatus Woesearchaeota archaeon]
MAVETFLKIKEILDGEKIVYTHLTHEYVRTSEDAAKIRGTNIEDAAKAIVLKAEHKNGDGSKRFDFVQAIIPAHQRIDLKKLKIILDSKNVSLASPDEVLERTGCTVGSVPPFGKLFNIPMYMDESILKKDYIVFSAGTHNDSIQMKAQDYHDILGPKVVEFKKFI